MFWGKKKNVKGIGRAEKKLNVNKVSGQRKDFYIDFLISTKAPKHNE